MKAPRSCGQLRAKHWAFAPGSIVRCVTEVKDDVEILVGRERVHHPLQKLKE